MLGGDLIYWIGWLGLLFAYPSFLYLAWRGLYKDPEFGTRRCPKCWHNLSHTRGLRCTECGFDAKDERQLFKRRRRPLYAWVGVMGCVGLTIWINDRVVTQGWVNYVPTNALIFSLPYTIEEHPEISREMQGRLSQGVLAEKHWIALAERCIQGDGKRDPGTPRWAQTYGRYASFVQDHHKRNPSIELRDLLLRIPPVVEISGRDVWPANVSPRLAFALDDWWPQGGRGRVTVQPQISEAEPLVFYRAGNARFRMPYSLPLPKLEKGEHSIVLDIRIDRLSKALGDWEEMSRQTVITDLTIEDFDADEQLAAVDQPEMTEQMVQAFSAGAVKWPGGRSPLRIRYNPQYTSGDLFDDTAVGVRVELMRDGVVARRLDLWWPGGGNRRRAGGFETVYEDIQTLMSATSDQDWTVRVTGDRELALRVEDCSKFWAGQCEIPLSITVRDQPFPEPQWWPEGMPSADDLR